MKGKLSGQVALITGAASGMGEATARRFAQEGARLVIADVQVERGQRVAQEINDVGGSAIFLKCDVSDGKAVEKTVNATLARHGGLHILVNVAGIASFKAFHEFSEDDWNHIIGVNLKGMAEIIKRVGDVDGLFCANTLCAIGAMETAAKLGMKIGKQLAVVGIDDLDICTLDCISLTAIRQPYQQLTQIAMDMLINCIEEKRRLDLQVSLKPELIVRDSTKRKIGQERFNLTAEA